MAGDAQPSSFHDHLPQQDRTRRPGRHGRGGHADRYRRRRGRHRRRPRRRAHPGLDGVHPHGPPRRPAVREAVRPPRLRRPGRPARRPRRVPAAQHPSRRPARDAGRGPRRAGRLGRAAALAEGGRAGGATGRRVRPRRARPARSRRQRHRRMRPGRGRPAPDDPALLARRRRGDRGERRPLPPGGRGLCRERRRGAAQFHHRQPGARHGPLPGGPRRAQALGVGRLLRDLRDGGVRAEVPAPHRPPGAGQQRGPRPDAGRARLAREHGAGRRRPLPRLRGLGGGPGAGGGGAAARRPPGRRTPVVPGPRCGAGPLPEALERTRPAADGHDAAPGPADRPLRRRPVPRLRPPRPRGPGPRGGPRAAQGARRGAPRLGRVADGGGHLQRRGLAQERLRVRAGSGRGPRRAPPDGRDAGERHPTPPPNAPPASPTGAPRTS